MNPKYLLALPVLMAITLLLPVAYAVQWISNKLMKLTISIIEFLPEIDS